VNADGSPKEQTAEPAPQPTTAAQASGSVGGADAVLEPQNQTDNSWWWKVLIGIAACGMGMCCLVCVATSVALCCIRRRFVKNEYNAFQQKSKSGRNTFASEIMNATEKDFTEGFSSGDDSSAYEHEDALGPDTVPQEAQHSTAASQPLITGDDNSLFESDEYND